MARSYLLKTEIFPLLLKAARSRFLNPEFKFLFNHLGNIMKTGNMFEGAYWRAVNHPKPLHPLHILILPKTSIPSLVEAPKDSAGLNFDLFALVKKLIEKFNFETCGHRLITNGGTNQSVLQWHWHLIIENYGETSD